MKSSMSAAATLKAASAAESFLVAAFGWVFVWPVARLFQRRRDWVVVIGRDDGKFVDNAKYFYLQATSEAPELELVFVTARHDVTALLNAQGHLVARFPSFAAVWRLLRAGTIVVDSAEWHRNLRRFLVIGAKIVQLWHGVGFKRIEIDKWHNEVAGRSWAGHPATQSIMAAIRIFLGRLVTYDLVNTTSGFYRDQVFARAFRARHLLAAGYPRNTFGVKDQTENRTAWSNVDPEISALLPEWLRLGRRLVLVAPTFRDSRATPLGLTPEVRLALDEWCDRNSVELLFKFHPLESGAEHVRGNHLHRYSSDKDIYPLLPKISALVTDYSSIYMDYLLIDRPILFLVPDLDAYLHLDRQMQFDFEEMTPGPKVMDWKELTAELLSQWRDDAFARERWTLRTLAFDELEQSEATCRLLDFMRMRDWLPVDSRDTGIPAPRARPAP